VGQDGPDSWATLTGQDLFPQEVVPRAGLLFPDTPLWPIE
jgi:hypothetical protein